MRRKGPGLSLETAMPGLPHTPYHARRQATAREKAPSQPVHAPPCPTAYAGQDAAILELEGKVGGRRPYLAEMTAGPGYAHPWL